MDKVNNFTVEKVPAKIKFDMDEEAAQAKTFPEDVGGIASGSQVYILTVVAIPTLPS